MRCLNVLSVRKLMFSSVAAFAAFFFGSVVSAQVVVSPSCLLEWEQVTLQSVTSQAGTLDLGDPVPFTTDPPDSEPGALFRGDMNVGASGFWNISAGDLHPLTQPAPCSNYADLFPVDVSDVPIGTGTIKPQDGDWSGLGNYCLTVTNRNPANGKEVFVRVFGFTSPARPVFPDHLWTYFEGDGMWIPAGQTRDICVNLNAARVNPNLDILSPVPNINNVVGLGFNAGAFSPGFDAACRACIVNNACKNEAPCRPQDGTPFPGSGPVGAHGCPNCIPESRETTTFDLFIQETIRNQTQKLRVGTSSGGDFRVYVQQEFNFRRNFDFISEIATRVAFDMTRVEFIRADVVTVHTGGNPFQSALGTCPNNTGANVPDDLPPNYPGGFFDIIIDPITDVNAVNNLNGLPGFERVIDVPGTPFVPDNPNTPANECVAATPTKSHPRTSWELTHRNTNPNASGVVDLVTFDLLGSTLNVAALFAGAPSETVKRTVEVFVIDFRLKGPSVCAATVTEVSLLLPSGTPPPNAAFYPQGIQQHLTFNPLVSGTPTMQPVNASEKEGLGFPLVPNSWIRGDVNFNAVIDTAQDIVDLIAIVLGLIPLPRNCPAAVDVNNDGRQDILDAITLIQAVFDPAGPVDPPQPFPNPGRPCKANGPNCPNTADLNSVLGCDQGIPCF